MTSLKKTSSHQHKKEFLCIASLALVTAYIPLLSIPLTWIETYFHEISHGMAALLTGGSIHKIVLNLDGSGLCYTSGGIRFFTVFFGYFGAVLWGMLIFFIAQRSKLHQILMPASFLAGLMLFSAIFYARDMVTLAILASIFVLFVAIILLVTKLKNPRFAQLALKFIGLFVLFNAVRSPLHLFDGKHIGDGAALQNMLLLPEFVWVIAWVLLGLAGVFVLWKSTAKLDKNAWRST